MNEEIRNLVAKSEKFLATAARLYSEADYDSAVSRLYYAMFYCAEALLLTKGMAFSTHGNVHSGFGQHFAKTGELPADLHRWLLEAFEKRQAGDYDSVSGLEAADVFYLQERAKQFVQDTKKYQGSAS